MIITSILTAILAAPALTAKAPTTTTLHCTNDPDKLTVAEVDESTAQVRVMTNGGDEIKGTATVTRSGDDATTTLYLLPFQTGSGAEAPQFFTLRKTVTVVKAGEETKWVLLARNVDSANTVTRPCTIAK